MKRMFGTLLIVVTMVVVSVSCTGGASNGTSVATDSTVVKVAVDTVPVVDSVAFVDSI
jgi:hypothetical protein